MDRIGVFPAAGKLGYSISRHLLQTVDLAKLILISRDPAKTAQELSSEEGVTLRKADYDRPESLGSAFAGILHLVLISYASLEIEHRIEAHKSAIDAAIRSGVSHIFYTSLAFGGDCTSSSQAHVMQAHLQTEAYLKCIAASTPGLSFTAVREGIYSESFPMYIGFPEVGQSDASALCSGRETRAQIPHDGFGPGVAWAKIDDLGEATAQLVRKNYENNRDIVQEYENQVVLLSGPRSYSLNETLAIFSAASKTMISLERVSVDDYTQIPAVQQNLGSHGQSDVPRKRATTFEAIRGGESAVPSDRLQQLLGREPESLETTLGATSRDTEGK